MEPSTTEPIIWADQAIRGLSDPREIAKKISEHDRFLKAILRGLEEAAKPNPMTGKKNPEQIVVDAIRQSLSRAPDAD